MRTYLLTLPLLMLASPALLLRAEDEPPSPNWPLHERIDALMAAKSSFAAVASERASDAEFLRRIYLDLTGRLPAPKVTRAFLEDRRPAAQKRSELVEQLLDSPEHARRLQNVFDLMIMERRSGANVTEKEWREFLRESIFANKSWRDLVTELLAADGAKPDERGAAKFYLDRDFNIDQVTLDVGRIFLGVDLECAQCHDHPAIGDYLQRHYYGISAFLKRSYVFTDTKSKKKMLGEKADGGDTKFTSVFTDESSSTFPRLLELPEVADPKPDEDPYVTKPSKKDRGVPKYSRRLQLARAIVSNDNVAFRRNIANRMWALMMGRGLIEPLDIHHSDNPATHPAVLELLSSEFAYHNYDVRWLLKQLAMSETYQRSSRLKAADAGKAEQLYAVGLLKPLSPEQLVWAVMDATGVSEKALAAEVAKHRKQLADRKTKQKTKDGTKQDAADDKSEDPRWREEAVHKALKTPVDKFVAMFAGQGGQKTSFDATAEQALFLINGDLLRGWLAQDGGLRQRLEELEDESAIAEELYVSVLVRKPSAEETADVVRYLEDVKDRKQGVQELLWALISSAEFRFNH